MTNGKADGAMNAEAFINAFGADVIAAHGTEFLMFLDVEGPPHSLSPQYYKGWSTALAASSKVASGGRFTLLPALYATQADDATWQVVRAAGGDLCFGAWVARWRVHGCSKPLDFRSEIVQPKVQIGCPVLLWQYANDCNGGDGIDCDEVTPVAADSNFLLTRLIIPPNKGTGPEVE